MRYFFSDFFKSLIEFTLRVGLLSLPILIALPLIGLVFIFLSSENDENAEQSKKSALWTSTSNFFLSLYLPLFFFSILVEKKVLYLMQSILGVIFQRIFNWN